jgi:hypothetical protein
MTANIHPENCLLAQNGRYVYDEAQHAIFLHDLHIRNKEFFRRLSADFDVLLLRWLWVDT